MRDITSATEGRRVTYSAETTRADNWMKEVYGSHTVTFNLFEDYELIKDFVAEAKAKGFAIAEF